ncbi:hypothetical protein DFH08DRAFT_940842 [Mycena albidolilacea]|uniref:Uncharacterized protein n=1 Tax=Mycena albidolilacea TaxID=1033008 RepID=A0AAD6ZKX5_9AGAR|nr:hypothetical protein DFH08DRAFT_940842 [Mycena albidolilacea]
MSNSRRLVPVRFRPHVPDSSTATEIKHGYDLLSPSGLPWQVTLPQVACRAVYAGIRDQLLEKNLVTVEQLSQCLAIFGDRGSVNPRTTLFRMDQKFPVDFSPASNVTAVGQALYSFKMEHMFQAYAGDKRCFPWAGSGLVRFEPSTDPQYSQRRVVHLRITKIVTLISRSTQLHRDPTLVLKPEEGQLLTRAPTVMHLKPGRKISIRM